MTFTEIQTEIKSRLNLTSTTADTRIGIAINRAYKKLTTSIGLNVSRRTQVQATATLGVQTLTFTGIEKVIAVIDKSSGSDRHIQDVFLDELKKGMIGTGAPTKWAVNRMNAGTVQIYMDTVPQEAFTLYADGYERASTLSGSQEPAFPESFHDIIVEGVLIEEYLKLEKESLSRLAKENYEDRRGDLRIFIQLSPTQDIYQGKLGGSSPGGTTITSGSGSSINGATSYTQTGLITFDLGAGVAPFAVAQATAAVVTNFDADLLDGQHGAYYRTATNMNAGTLPLARLVDITNTEIAAAAAIAWTKLSKTGSSLADLTTRSAADLSSGNLAIARLGLGTTTSASSTATGSQNDWAPGLVGNTFVNWSGASAMTVTGIAGGVSGQRFLFRNTGTQVALFAHNSSSSLSGNRFFNSATSASTPVAAGGHAEFVFNGTFWVMVNHDQGAWITPTFAAGDYTGNGSLTWTVAVGDVAGQKYRLNGRTLIVTAEINTSTTGGTANTALQIGNGAWGGFTVGGAGNVDGWLLYNNAGGGFAVGSCRVVAAGVVIQCFKVDFSNWSNAAVDNTFAYVNLTFEVQ